MNNTLATVYLFYTASIQSFWNDSIISRIIIVQSMKYLVAINYPLQLCCLFDLMRFECDTGVSKDLAKSDCQKH